VESAAKSVSEAHTICWIVDACRKEMSGEDLKILSMLEGIRIPVFLILNKIDLLKSDDQLNQITEVYSRAFHFSGVIAISALKKLHLQRLIQCLRPHIPEGEAWYDEDIFINETERFWACEILREKVLSFVRDEVPHAVAAEIDEYKSPDEYPGRKKLYIRGRLVVETPGQKAILIGKDGSMLKKIGSAARVEIEALTGHQVYLDLRVQVREKWRHSSLLLKRFGYTK
jgi:GTP-binding protein Era